MTIKLSPEICIQHAEKTPYMLHTLCNSRVINQNKLRENNTKLSSTVQRGDNWANKETFQ